MLRINIIYIILYQLLLITALALEATGEDGAEGAAARWSRIRNAAAAAGSSGGTLRTFAAAGLARLHHAAGDSPTAEHWYSIQFLTFDVSKAIQ